MVSFKKTPGFKRCKSACLTGIVPQVNTLVTESKIRMANLSMVLHTFLQGCQKLRMALEQLQVDLHFSFANLQESI